MGSKTRSEFIIEDVVGMVTTLAEVGGVLFAGLVVRAVAGNGAGFVTLSALTVYPMLVCYKHISLSETGSFFLLSLLVWLLFQLQTHWPDVQKHRRTAVCGLAVIALGPPLLAYPLSVPTSCPLYFPFVLLLSLFSFWWLLISLKEGNPIGLAMTSIPLVFLLFQVLSERSAFAAYPLLITNAVALLSVARRGWINKRMPDTL